MRDVDRAFRLRGTFTRLFGDPPGVVVRAPGRVNLIGEHTDYNDGFVLPIAIDRSVLVAARRRPDRVVNVHSANFGRSIAFSIDDREVSSGDKLRGYVHGVARCLEARGYLLQGMDAVVKGDVPIGSGLSSSAALEIAIIHAFEAVSGLIIPPSEKARVGQEVENEYIGVQSGIMDQLVSIRARKDHALLIDCRALSYEPIPMGTREAKIVVCDSGVRRSLDRSEYNRRREECQKGVEILSTYVPGIRSLRDVALRDLESLRPVLPEPVGRRCLHVAGENERVLRGASALNGGDTAGLGRLMSESHESLRGLYDVSCAELDLLVEAAMRVQGVLGSRMTGAGFGGCTVSLVRSEAVDDFSRRVGGEYRDTTGRNAQIWICEPAEGAGTIFEDGRDLS